jgi:uncharacterized protein
MRVVIDTKIVISAILRDRTPETILQFIIASPDWEWMASSEIVTEYLGVLQRPKFNLPDPIIQQWRTVFATTITLIGISDPVAFPRDPKDAKFLACARQSDADYFITGDRDFNEAPAEFSTIICSVQQFHQQFITPNQNSSEDE